MAERSGQRGHNQGVVFQYFSYPDPFAVPQSLLGTNRVQFQKAILNHQGDLAFSALRDGDVDLTRQSHGVVQIQIAGRLKF